MVSTCYEIVAVYVEALAGFYISDGCRVAKDWVKTSPSKVFMKGSNEPPKVSE